MERRRIAKRYGFSTVRMPRDQATFHTRTVGRSRLERGAAQMQPDRDGCDMWRGREAGLDSDGYRR